MSVDPFVHYMYVIECEDASLYAGYSVDVAGRFAAHCAGRGARYTRSHHPKRLRAAARFYSRSRALRAEALFKRLSRSRKEDLLQKAANEPFEDVLSRELPGFGEEPPIEYVRRELAAHIDNDFRLFQIKLMPSVALERVVGVRTPHLRAIARTLSRRSDRYEFLQTMPHQLFEEDQIHAFCLGLERDFDVALPLYDAFLPHIDNWATCDQLPLGVLAQDVSCARACARRWMASGQCYPTRFGIGVLMRLFLDEHFDEQVLVEAVEARLPHAPQTPRKPSDAYYVDMMRAWLFAEALIKQPAAAMPYIAKSNTGPVLDEWTRRCAICKALDSRRTPQIMREQLYKLRSSN